MKDLATMTTREIAELTGKRHNNVVRDMRFTFKKAGIAIDGMNNQQTEYKLDKEQTMILISSYPIPLRARVVKRWLELELETGNDFYIPKTLPEALQLAADLHEIIDKQALQIEQDQPRVKLAKALESAGSISLRTWMSATKKGYSLDIKDRKIIAWLIEEGYLYRLHNETTLRAYASHDDKFNLAPFELPSGRIKWIVKITGVGVQTITPRLVEDLKFD